MEVQKFKDIDKILEINKNNSNKIWKVEKKVVPLQYYIEKVINKKNGIN
jgi:hypothetical protein